jgi:hypothetical protein
MFHGGEQVIAIRRITGWMAIGIATVATVAIAGERTSIQGLGMGRVYVAMARGLDAALLNPAGLDADSTPVTFTLLPFGVHMGSDFLTYDLYTSYFTGEETGNGRTARNLSDADKQSILAAFPDGVGTLGFDAEARPFGLAVHTGLGSLAFSVTENASAAVHIPNAYVRFLFYGNTPGSVYDFGESSMSAWWIREYALTLATTLHNILGLADISTGVTVKVVHGYGYAELTRFNSRLETGTDGVLHGIVDMHNRTAGIDPLTGGEGGYSPFPAPAGSGLGVDVGFATSLTPALRVGLSVTDIGSILWTRNVREASADSSFVIDNPLDAGQRDGVEKALQGTSSSGASFSTPLPTTVRVGAALEVTKLPVLRKFIFGDLTVGCDMSQVLQDAPGDPAGTRLSLGMEWCPWGFLPLRAGYGWGGPDHTNFALGFGVHVGFFDLDIASEDLGWLFSPKTISYGSLSAGMKFRL